MRVVGDPRRGGEATVVVGHEAGEERRGGDRGGEAWRRSSFTSRSCSVPLARSTRPFACGLWAQMLSMLSSRRARPNWESPGPPWARSRVWTWKTLSRSL